MPITPNTSAIHFDGHVHYGPLYPRSSGSEGYLTEGIDTIFEKLETAQEKLDLLNQILTWINMAEKALTPKQ